jgi:hypothetical protein
LAVDGREKHWQVEGGGGKKKEERRSGKWRMEEGERQQLNANHR